MSGDGGFEGLLVEFGERLALEVLETVEVVWRSGDNKIRGGRGGELEHGLEEIAATFLEILAERVEVGSIDDGSGENSLLLLALGFAKKLFPPFGELLEVRLKSGENFEVEALAKEVGAEAGVA